jgi:hypothetical protein
MCYTNLMNNEDNKREICNKRFAVTTTLYNKVYTQLKYHMTPNDLLTEMWELWAKVHHIEDGEENGNK